MNYAHNLHQIARTGVWQCVEIQSATAKAEDLYTNPLPGSVGIIQFQPKKKAGIERIPKLPLGGLNQQLAFCLGRTCT